MAAAPRAKSDTAARARRDRRRQRMMPGNGADRSVGRGWVTQYPSASKRPPRAKVQPHPPDANVTVLFPPHDGARPRAADLLANSPEVEQVGEAYACGQDRQRSSSKSGTVRGWRSTRTR